MLLLYRVSDTPGVGGKGVSFPENVACVVRCRSLRTPLPDTTTARVRSGTHLLPLWYTCRSMYGMMLIFIVSMLGT